MKDRGFLSSLVNTSYSRRTLPHELRQLILYRVSREIGGEIIQSYYESDLFRKYRVNLK
jgi:hypothetical protein